MEARGRDHQEEIEECPEDTHAGRNLSQIKSVLGGLGVQSGL